MLIFAIIFFTIIMILCTFIIFDTIRGKGKLGINPWTTFCPNCGQKAPTVRTPTSIHQALFGGWTCSACGFEMDKWGEEVISKNKITSQHKQIYAKETDFIKPSEETEKTHFERIFRDEK